MLPADTVWIMVRSYPYGTVPVDYRTNLLNDEMAEAAIVQEWPM